jgi:hypothetical protein
LVRILGAKRKELLAISSIRDAKVGQNGPAAARFGQNHPSCRQNTSPGGRPPSALFLKLNDFGLKSVGNAKRQQDLAVAGG